MMEFLATIEKLATALIPFIGFDTAVELQHTAIRLRRSLADDESILDL